jgi:hypothetical protein
MVKKKERKIERRGTGGGVGGVPVVASPWGCWSLLEGSTVFLGLHLILAFMHELGASIQGKRLPHLQKHKL